MDYPGNLHRISGQALRGWCIAFRVWVVGSDGEWIPDAHLRQSLNSAVQHHQIYGRLWDNIGGLGPRDAHKRYPLDSQWGGDWDYSPHTRNWVDNTY